MRIALAFIGLLLIAGLHAEKIAGSAAEGTDFVENTIISGGGLSFEASISIGVSRKFDITRVMWMLEDGLGAAEIRNALEKNALRAAGTIKVDGTTYVMPDGNVSGNAIEGDLYIQGESMLIRAGRAALVNANGDVGGTITLNGAQFTAR